MWRVFYLYNDHQVFYTTFQVSEGLPFGADNHRKLQSRVLVHRGT